MASRIIRVFVTFVLLASTLPFIVGAGNAGNGDAARAEHQRIIEFWTPERVAQAVPRDFVFDPGTGRFSPTKGKPDGTPGGGGGNGGGGGEEDSTLVSGASWNAGGQIDGAVGKVLFQMDGSYWVCSATVIADANSTAREKTRSLILTAAHCVFDETNDQFASEWMFIPDYDDQPASLTTSGTFCVNTRYGCWTASELAVHTGYATAGSFSDGLEFDFAVVAVGDGGKLDSQLDATVNAQQYDFSDTAVASGEDTYAFGYPAQKKWKGNDLIYCRGPIDTDPINNGDTYRLNGCKLNGGSSGGAWLTPFDLDGFGAGTVVSVNSYGYRGIDAMHGPKLNSDTQAVYTAVLGVLIEGTNTIAR